MYVLRRQRRPLGEWGDRSWWQDILVTACSIVIGTLIVDMLRKRKDQ